MDDFEAANLRQHSTRTRVCCLFSVAFFFFLAALNFFTGTHSLAFILTLCLAVSLLCLLIPRYIGNARVAAFLLCSTHIILTWFLFMAGEHKQWSLLWSFCYPCLFMVCFGSREGAAVTLFFICSMLVMSLPPIQALMLNQYDADVLIRYFIVLIVVSVISFAMELVRDKLKCKLLLLVRQVRNMAFTDPLTGLGNRLAFEQCLQAEYSRFLRSHESFCLIMGDIDHFKRINDNKGHQAGDAVLQHVAETLRKRLRRQDSVFRWGGEEFMLVIIGAKEEYIASVAEQLRQAVAASPCLYRGENIGCTMSFGAYYCKKNESAEQAMEKVDKLLYAAKHAGRNKVMTDDPSG